MSADVANIIGIVGGLFGLLALLAGAAVYLRASYAKARIEALNNEIEEEKRRSGQLRVDITELQGRNATLEAKVLALNELVTQRAQLDGLRASIEAVRLDQLTLSRTVDRVLDKVTET